MPNPSNRLTLPLHKQKIEWLLNDEFTESLSPVVLASGGVSAPNPTLGSEALADTGFDDAGSWTISGSGASVSGSKGVWTAATNGMFQQSNKRTLGKWYQCIVDVDSLSGGTLSMGYLASIPSLSTTGAGQVRTGRSITTTIFALGVNTGTPTAAADNASQKEITFNTTMSTITEATQNKVLSVDITMTYGTLAGLVINLDSSSNPQNFVLAHINGQNAYLDKCVGGTWSTVTSGAITYSAGATLKVVKSGTLYFLVYDNAIIGTPTTISDAGIVSGTLAGLFSTYASNSFANFLIKSTLDGTQAQPTGGLRIVCDTNQKLSTAAGKLSIATGSSTGGDPVVHYPIQSRIAGRMLLGKFNVTSSAGTYPGLGWDTNTIGGGAISMVFFNSNSGICTVGGGFNVSFGNVSTGADYIYAIILRSTGSLMFVKGGAYTNWTFVWPDNVGTGSVYPYVGVNTATAAVMTFDFARIPEELVSIRPFVSDSFNRADGALGTTDGAGSEEAGPSGHAWTANASWAISGNSAVCTPTLSSELVVDGGFDDPTKWTMSGSPGPTVTGSTLDFAGVSIGGASQTVFTVHRWYRISIDAVSYTSGSVFFNYLGSSSSAYSGIAGTGTTLRTGRVTNTAFNVSRDTGTVTLSVDNASAKEITLADTFAVVRTPSPDVVVEVAITMTANANNQTPCGLVLSLDSTSNPQNFILCYHNGKSVVLEDHVNGVPTAKITATATYSAGARLIVVRDGNKCRVYYNNALVGTEQTMTANTSTLHGLFSTYSGNTLDNFVVWSRGANGEYSFLDKYIK